MKPKSALPGAVGLRATMLATLALCSFAGAAHATKYKYTGLNYTTIEGGSCLTTSMHITAAFSVKGKLPANASSLGITPLSWMVSDSVNTTSSKANLGHLTIEVSTDANSNITGWVFSVSYDDKKGHPVAIESISMFGENEDIAADGACKSGTSEAFNQTPGTW